MPKMPKNTERPLGFFNIYSVAKHQKNVRGPFGERFVSKRKSHKAEKNGKRVPLVGCARYCMLREKKRKKNIFGSVR